MKAYLWPIVLTFAAGFTLGIIFARERSAPTPQELNPSLHSWATAFSDTLDLNSKQQLVLHHFLLEYQMDIQKEEKRLMEQNENRFIAIDDRHEALIFDKLLRSDQQERAKELLRPIEFPGGGGGR
ncbi:MAG: hypothetical protein QGH51_08450 [Planctomycetota bacterium]|jgi:hypothetical protein|nr:hypothetical protein [Planctomycetota bacterium]